MVGVSNCVQCSVWLCGPLRSSRLVQCFRSSGLYYLTLTFTCSGITNSTLKLYALLKDLFSKTEEVGSNLADFERSKFLQISRTYVIVWILICTDPLLIKRRGEFIGTICHAGCRKSRYSEVRM